MKVEPGAAEARLAESLAGAGLGRIDVACVLGSGLGAFAERLQSASAVSFADLARMPRSSVPGHAGRFVIGELGGARVLCQQGRVHLYEGWSARQVTLSVRAFALLGCKNLLLTNAAGGLVRGWPVPCLMRLTDHLNLQGRPPLQRGEQMTACAYDERVAGALDDAAQATQVTLRSGVYAGLLGPTYETPAEVRQLASMGAHAVGMSTVAEASVAHVLGMRVGAISCISNAAAGISPAPLSHAEVVAAGREIADDFGSLLAEAVPRVAALG